MVNVNNSRHDILIHLKESQGPLSGESLCRRLGISRVAVWKQINKLEELGYEIHTSRKGYELKGEPKDMLEPHLFDHPQQFYCLKETGSTMDFCDQLLQSRKTPGEFIVTAETQSAGRGRNERDWISGEGGLFFTHTFPLALPIPLSYHPAMAALISLTQVLREDYGLPAVIKWPNDIQIDGKKVMGLLSTGRTEGEKLIRSNLGIGINVNNAPPLDKTCSLSRLTGKNLSRSELMKRYLEKWRIHRQEKESLHRLFSSYLHNRGEIRILTEGGTLVSGRFKALSREGALLLETGDRVYPGECKRVLNAVSNR